MAKIAFGTTREATDTGCLKSLVAEFICSFLFVFTGVGAAMTADRMVGSPLLGLLVVAVAHALVTAVMISAGLSNSAGNLSPAVTLGLVVSGHITVFRSILYWIVQLLASSLACILLKYLTGGLDIPVQTLGSGVSPVQGVIMEMVITFSLLFVVYATILDPKKGSLDGLGPLLIGLVVGANILAAAPFSGASMNPARFVKSKMWEMRISNTSKLPDLFLINKPWKYGIVRDDASVAG
ncbi:PREDICTED: aquaporin TIP4-1-like [Nelumbo nucifera]|uniref:Aquaporin TIP4-1-like n=1 Tax=Nelumbo nucifera TaxID=4432 RepID=A0A1U7ZZ07_NELNU|nr:PREDICTED: aquaporin TIP4-1-like [Nelumbo nucifera]